MHEGTEVDLIYVLRDIAASLEVIRDTLERAVNLHIGENSG